MRMLEYDSAAALKRDLPRDLLRTYGNGTFLDAIEETEGALHARLGLEVPEVLADPGKDTHVLSFLQLRGVTNLRFKRHGREFKSGRLEREEFFRHAAERRDDLVQRAETAMVEAARDEIVRVQPIGSGLNPIREILVYVNEEGSLESRLLDPDKKRRYLPLLEALGYVAQKKGVIRPGPELEKFSVARKSIQGDPEFYMALLGEVLRRGYRDL